MHCFAFVDCFAGGKGFWGALGNAPACSICPSAFAQCAISRVLGLLLSTKGRKHALIGGLGPQSKPIAHCAAPCAERHSSRGSAMPRPGPGPFRGLGPSGAWALPGPVPFRGQGPSGAWALPGPGPFRGLGPSGAWAHALCFLKRAKTELGYRLSPRAPAGFLSQLSRENGIT